MKIAIIGPSHPYKGGITQQTTELATRLATAGHNVEVLSWKSQFPKLLYPGSLLPDEQPEMAVYANTRRRLSWYNPLSWWQAGRYACNFELVIFIWWIPTIQGPIYRFIRRHLKANRTAVICHNVLPHESRPGDRWLTHGFLSSVDHVIVHSAEQASIAKTLTASPITVTDLPPILPGWNADAARHAPGVRRHLLFFGIVRDYKGLDVLLAALAHTPDISLTVAGEFWGDLSKYEDQIATLGIGERVQLQPGYIAAEQIPQLFQAADALVLPYRSATGTTNIQLAFAYNVPVIASNLSILAAQLQDGRDGLLFDTGDAVSLSHTIQKLYQAEVFERLHHNLPAVTIDKVWQTYEKVVLQ